MVVSRPIPANGPYQSSLIPSLNNSWRATPTGKKVMQFCQNTRRNQSFQPHTIYMRVTCKYSRFPRDLGTRLTKSRVCRSGTRANSMYIQNFSLGWRLTFANFWFCGSSQNFFPAKFGGVASLARHVDKKPAIRASFLRENRIFHQFAKFSPSKFPLYGIASSS